MSNHSFPYSEEVLQWIWNEGFIDLSALQTTCGKTIQVINPGTLNTSDGPDFLFATILVDGIKWCGSIEMHLSSSGWYQHKHHNDSNYNNVILHVVVQNNPKSVKTKSGSQPFTVNLLPALSPEVQTFIKNLSFSKKLPCAQNLHFISDEVFEKQIKQAHNEYLEKKTEDFLSFYDPSKLQSIAWKHALIISIFDGFGISKNRMAMQQVAKALIHATKPLTATDLFEIAFGEHSKIKWNYKGCRPNNHPRKRIETAFHFSQQILNTSFESFLSDESILFWRKWCLENGTSYTGRVKILFGTVYLPALYLLGNLYASEKLKTKVLKNWQQFSAPIPPILLKKFKMLDVEPSIYKNKLGAIHQLNNYCYPKRCVNCRVLKKAFLS